MKKLIYISSLLLLVYSCKKPIVPTVICDTTDCLTIATCTTGDCINVGDSIVGSWYTEEWAHGSHQNFAINPNNTDEIAFYNYSPDSTGDDRLMFYNKKTKEERFIYKGNKNLSGGRSSIVWSHLGWIIFDINNQIYKTQKDGSQLTQLTGGEYFKRLGTVSPDGVLLYYYNDSTESLNTYNLINNTIEEVPNSRWIADEMSMSPDGKQIAFVKRQLDGPSWLSILNLETEEITGLFKSNQTEYGGTTWSKDGLYIYWSDYYGFYKVDVNTQTVEKILSHCGIGTKTKYNHPKIADDGTFYLTRESSQTLWDIDIYTKGEIIEFDPETCSEYPIF